MDLKERGRKIKEDIPVLLLALRDKDTPILAKILGAVAIIYAFSPIDLIPDFIPVLVYLDDILILPLLIVETIKLIPKEVIERNGEKVQVDGVEKKGKKWIYAIPIIIIWVIIIVIIVKTLGGWYGVKKS